MKRIATLFCAISILAGSIVSAQESHVFHVSPKGNDNSPGTALRPWKTLEHAIKRVQDSHGDVRLIIEDGDYFLTATLELKDIVGRKVSIEAAPGQKPQVRGDRRLKGFSPLKDRAVLSQLQPQARTKVLVADLRASGIKDFGNPCSRENLFDLYWKGQRATLARYPDAGFLKSGKALGQTRVDDVTLKEGLFSYEEDRISSWAMEKDGWIYGYFRWDWSDQYEKIAGIEPDTKSVTLQEPWHYYGYKDGFRFYGINLLCELDSPGEYYVDRQKGKLYWYAPEGYSKEDEVTASCFNGDFMLSMTDCSDVEIKGLTFIGGRGNAVKLEKVERVSLLDVGICRFGGDALQIVSSKDVSVDGCRFETLGHSGIKSFGGDRKTLEKAGYSITNTVIKDFSLFKHTYEPAVFFSGCGLTIAHCDFSGSSSSAMRIDGSEALIEYNHFHDLVKESDDQGGLDMYFNYGYRGVVVRYNLWENILGGSLHGAAGVRFDDMISGQLVYGNIFNNVGALNFGAVQIHGGKDNVVDNNVFYKCNSAVSFSQWSEERWNSYLDSEGVHKQLYEDVDISSPLYTERYPDLRRDPRDGVNRNIVKNNLAIGCPVLFFRENGRNKLQNNSALFLGESAELKKPLEYYLDPEVLESFGLEPIPYKEIGPEGMKAFL